MIWLFERGNAIVRLETRFDKASDEYLVVIGWADRPSETERFRDFEQFHTRILALEHQLQADHWTQIGGPTIIPDGWRGP
jgi:hypothetical protein